MAMFHSRIERAHHVALLFSLAATCASAQTPPASTTQTAETITVTARSTPVLEADRASAGGFGDVPVGALPQSVSVFTTDLLRQTTASTLSQLLRLDASLADAYNTVGYHQSATVRGFTLDSVYNYRRDGLPILNFGPLPFDNKARVEVLKGVSGMLSGTSVPGGLINLVSARPTVDPFAALTLRGEERGTIGLNADLGGRLANSFGYRLNASADRLRPEVDNADGSRQFAGGAFEFRVAPSTLLSADVEWQRFRQPSVPGLSPLDSDGDGVGDTLPSPVRPRLNLNSQPWSKPFVTRSTLGVAKLSHAFSDAWRLNVAAQRQRAITDDRVAFPDGCSTQANYVYPGFCGNGDFDVYDFRSDNERRTLDVIDANLQGKLDLASAATTLTVGAQQRRYTQRMLEKQAYNFVGTSNLFTPVTLAEEGTPRDLNTVLDERSREAYAQAHVKTDGPWAAFAGVRVADQRRKSQRTDGSSATNFDQRITSPWAGITFAPTATSMLYASWGRGAESDVVPNRPLQYVNYGQALPTLKSTQTEVGGKWQANERFLLSVAAFEIKRPFGDDVPDTDGLVRRVAGGKEARHRGLELNAAGRVLPQLSLVASLASLDARYTKAVDDALIGRRVTNVPRLAASLFADFRVDAVPGLALSTLITSQSKKSVTADNTLEIPALTLVDLGARYTQRIGARELVWRVNVENVADRAAWRESPTQPWGGIYLFPAAPRTLRGSVTFNW